MAHKQAEMLCGESTVGIQVPESAVILDIKPMPPLPDQEAAVYAALKAPLYSPPLSKIAEGRKNACIVISDFTRPVPNKIILPPLLATLAESGMKPENITILIATGMHRPNLGEELESLVGREIMDGYPIVNHYCRKPEEYRKIDEIDGAPIEINNHYLDADLKILTGLIEPHFYAGYSGGRKAVLPGISSFETMKFMHSFKMIDHPRVTNCILEGNPFHEYGIRVTELAGADFILNVVINKKREIAGVFAGHFNQAHLAGCNLVREHSVLKLDRRMDLVITSGGGFPLDATFYQISKALICAMDILKKGGDIVVACECREGLGNPEFCNILRSTPDYKNFCDHYSEPCDFTIDQWCAQNIYQALDHAGRVFVYSPGLSSRDLAKMGIVKIDDLQDTVNNLAGSAKDMAVIPDGPYVVGMV